MQSMRWLVVSFAITAVHCSGAPPDAPPVRPLYGTNLQLANVFDAQAVWHSALCAPGQVCQAGDVNGDGLADLVIFNHGASATVQVALSNGQSFGAPAQVSSSFCKSSEICQVADVDHNGQADLVSIARNGSISVLFATGNSWSSPSSYPNYVCSSGSTACMLADVDGNGYPDIVSFNSSGQVRVSRTPTGRFAIYFSTNETWLSGFCPSPDTTCTVGDVTGDGKADAIAFGVPGLDERVTVAPSTGTSFATPLSWAGQACQMGWTCAVGDVTGDGAADAVWFHNPGEVDVGVAYNPNQDHLPATSFDKPAMFHEWLGAGAGSTLIADVNGDKIGDVISLTQGSSNRRVFVALSEGNGRMLNHRGAVMTGDANGQHKVYLAFLGSFSQTSQSLLQAFVNGLGGSAYWGIFSGYTDSAGNHIQNTMNVAGTSNYSTWTSFNPDDQPTLIANLQQRFGALDPTAIYVFLLGPDVTDTSTVAFGGGSRHYPTTVNPQHIKVAVVAYAAANQPSPNGDSTADGMVSNLAHELAETLTDPDEPGGWYAGGSLSTGFAEVGDLCVAVSGTPGQSNTVTLGGRNWLVQTLFQQRGTGGNLCAGMPFSPAPLIYLSLDDAQTIAGPSNGWTYNAMSYPSTTNYGLVYNTVIGQQRIAKLGQSFYFNGINSHISLGLNSTLYFAQTGVSVSLWLYLPNGSLPSQRGHGINVFDKQNGSSGVQIWVDTNDCAQFRTDGNGSAGWPGYPDAVAAACSTPNQGDRLQANTWNHLLGTYTPANGNGSVNLFLNGRQVGYAPVAMPYAENSLPIWIGSSPYWQNNYVKGYIDEVQIWNQQLTPEQVQQLYKRGGSEGPL